MLRKMINWATAKGVRRELAQFTDMLRGMDLDERREFFALVRAAREVLSETPEIYRACSIPYEDLDRTTAAVMHLGMMIREMQRNRHLNAAGSMMPWQHTLRVAGFPELRYLGREMWGVLVAGMEVGEYADVLPKGMEPMDNKV